MINLMVHEAFKMPHFELLHVQRESGKSELEMYPVFGSIRYFSLF